MKQLLLVGICFLLITQFVFSQESEILKLNQQMTVLYQQGKLDEAGRLAEKIVKIQKDIKSSDPKNLITALENLAQIKLTAYKHSLADLVSPDLKTENVKNLVEQMRKNGKDAESFYREALNLAKNNPQNPPEQIIGMQNNLAWILHKYIPNEANLPIGFDKQKKEQFDSLNKTRFYERIDEAESLYADALKRSENSFGGESDAVILSAYNFAEFLAATANFEAAIPQYQKCIRLIEKKYGTKSKDLVAPLEAYTKLLIATNQNDLAIDNVSRIVSITGKSMKFPKALLNISLRAEKSFQTVNSPTVEKTAIITGDRVYMGNLGNIINAGANLEAGLGVSTMARSYYDNPQAVKILRIPVRIVLDENGNPLETEALTDNNIFKESAEKTVKEWKFRPFTVSGSAKKISGYVECIFLDSKFTR